MNTTVKIQVLLKLRTMRFAFRGTRFFRVKNEKQLKFNECFF